MSSKELIIVLHQISNSFNNEPVWPFIERMVGLGLLVFCTGVYIYLTIKEYYTLKKIKEITND